ncbi:Flavin containing amine oxidoreductase [Aspergillus sclerotialis]|uniref:Amine oxidase n=1 Tax=Aspergillus sclerotialis TaxID=2070753 RepID=A0A3A2ZBT2_9EURO|nr:Flavin containing amine oxidoreductase [Aspergillus sclerotialis]
MFTHVLALFVASFFSTAALAEEVDVAIIGGGLAGLSAAKSIAAAGKTFAILEARDRVGGRVLNVPLAGGAALEVGAEFVGPTQDRVLALAADLGLTTYPTYSQGNSSLLQNGSVILYPSDQIIPPLEPNTIFELGALLQEVNALAAEIDVQAPCNHVNASEWDSITLSSFLDARNLSSDARVLVDTIIPVIFSAETSELSLLYTLSYVSAAGNETTIGTLDRLIQVAGGAQESRISGGAQLLALGLSEKLGQSNIYLNAPVRKIKFHAGRHKVISDRVQIFAKKVIVSMSPPMAARISYDPPLPAGRDQLTQRMPMGSIGKAIAIYPTPWWREAGLNAQGIADTGIIRTTFDNTPPGSSYGAIMGFIEADQMRQADALDEEQVNGLVIESLVSIFGPRAAEPTRIILQRWDLEEFSRGGPVAFAPPGVLTGYGTYLRAPTGGIHFAGTETSPYWTGYMDGAIRSGERAAAEVLRSL